MATIAEELQKEIEEVLPEMSEVERAAYEEGFDKGWSLAAFEALASLSRQMGDVALARRTLFGDVDPGGPTAAVLDELEGHLRDCACEDDAGGDLKRRGLDAAVRYLEAKGYEVVERGWSCPFGSVDVIALDEDGTLTFVDVRTRRGSDGGFPSEGATREKRWLSEKIALSFLADAWDGGEAPARFDAIGITVTGDGHALLRHHTAYLNCVA